MLTFVFSLNNVENLIFMKATVSQKKTCKYLKRIRAKNRRIFLLFDIYQKNFEICFFLVNNTKAANDFFQKKLCLIWYYLVWTSERRKTCFLPVFNTKQIRSLKILFDLKISKKILYNIIVWIRFDSFYLSTNESL